MLLESLSVPDNYRMPIDNMAKDIPLPVISKTSVKGIITNKQADITEDIQRQRQEILKQMCPQTGYKLQEEGGKVPHRLVVDEDRKFMWCIVPKVACSNWKRALGQTKKSALNSTWNGDKWLKHVHWPGYLTSIGMKPLAAFTSEERNYRLKHYFKFMFVRHPLTRLLSAWKEKFASLNKFTKRFHKQYMPRMVSQKRQKEAELNGTTPLVLFSEFLSYIANNPNKRLNAHWRSYWNICHPCSIPYAFIGKLETIGPDSKYVLERISGSDASDAFPPPERGPYVKHLPSTSDMLNKAYKDISQDTIARLQRVYSHDFTLFNYSTQIILH